MAQKGSRRRQSARLFESLDPRRLLSTVYVDVNSPAGSPNGNSWATAFTDLQQALTAAGAGDEIHVADGTYKPASADRNATFQLKNNVKLFGGYAGYGAASPDARDANTQRSFLSGDINVAGNSADNSYHVVNGSGVDATAMLDGFVVTAGNAVSPQSNGGGIYISAGSPTINNCTFTANRAAASGGAIYLTAGSSPYMINCTFAGNFANGGGGAIYSGSACAPIINNCTFRGNFAYEGGGINNAGGSSSTISYCKFVENAAQNGAGVFTLFTSATLLGCSFERNAATNQGGGVYQQGSDSAPNILYSTFYANTAFNGGGLYTSVGANGVIANCVFVGNSNLTNGLGGGICAGGNGKIVNCTISSNSGSGIGLGSFTGKIVNCVIWNNLVTPTPAANIITYSDVQGGATGTGNINATPAFLATPGVGLDQKWGTPDDVPGDMRLAATSPAIDFGDNASVPASGITFDSADQPRFVDKPGTGSGSGAIVDMGAYESQPIMARNGGPYYVIAGKSIFLSGSGSSFVTTPMSLAWDLDNDGQFDDSVSPSPTFNASSIPAGTVIPISLRATDQAQQSIIVSTTVTVVPTVVYVDARATSGSGNGMSWANAKLDLMSAIDNAVAGQELRVATGTYKPSSINDPSATFQLKNITLNGGYAGFGATNPDARDFNAYPTILSGDIGAPNANGDNSVHVVNGSNTTFNTILDGFTIIGGNADGRLDSFSNLGGGVYVKSGIPLLRNLRIVNNNAFRGAGIYNSIRGDSTITNCTIVGNVASFEGGGVYNQSCSPKITNTTIVGNNSGFGGAGIYSNGADLLNPACQPVLTNCTIVGNNTILGGGGAMYDYYASSTINNCIIWANTSPNGEQIAKLNAGTTATNSDIQGGHAGNGNIDLDPLFVRNPSVGGDSVWGTADDDFGDLRLQIQSPAIDTGFNALVPSGITTDAAGLPRFFDFPGVGPSLVDMGARELDLRLGLLRVADNQSLVLPAGNRTFIVEQLSIGANATLDVKETDLILEYSGTSPLGVYGNPNYTGVLGMIQSDTKLKTTMPDAAAQKTLLGAAEASEVLTFGPGGTALWNGQTVDSTTVLVKYTYAGDANLDGVINADDYAWIDLYSQAPGSNTYNHGDFNFDGQITADDYALIDIMMIEQGGPL